MTARAFEIFALAEESPEALKQSAQRALTNVESSTAPLAELCSSHENVAAKHRVAIVCDSRETLVADLRAFVAGEKLRSGYAGVAVVPPKLAFLFTGQGAQYAGMGKTLFGTQPVFRAELLRCHELLQPHLPQPLLDVLFPSEGVTSPIDETQYSQPALFAIEWALSQMWRSFGVEPSAVLGHSVGEYVAATLAGVMKLEDGLALIATRGRLMQALPRDGEMVAVLTQADVVEKAVAPHSADVSIAAYNGPTSVVVSGRREAVRTVVSELSASKVRTQALTVSHAFHSPCMDPMLDEFSRVAGAMTFSAPTIPLASNVTGAYLEGAPDAAYWRAHVRGAVRFYDGMKTLGDDPALSFLEAGPNPTLIGMAKQFVPGDRMWLMSLRKGRDDWRHVSDSLAELYVRGADIAWDAVQRTV